MPEQRLRDINRPATIGPLKRLLLGLLGLTMLSGCYMPPFRFKAEAKALTAEAAERFPVGSSAAEFEAWFTSKGGNDFRGLNRGAHKAQSNEQCEMRSLVLQRAEGCMNLLVADYCVDNTEKLASLKFKQSGYC
jgi:hypothetical protein